MVTIDQPCVVETEVNRSKFIAHLVPMEKLEGLQAQLKAEHPKANHVVYAYRHLNVHDQIIENHSDDGEPRGAAGTPILNVLRGQEAIECGVLIVRYFGGIKLGVGGMVRAYTQAAQAAVRAAQWREHFTPVHWEFVTTYREIQHTQYHLDQLGITQIEREFGSEGVTWQISGSPEQIDDFRQRQGEI